MTSDFTEETSEVAAPVGVPVFELDWPQCTLDSTELQALVAEAQYRARTGTKPYCQVTLKALDATRGEEASLTSKSVLTPEERARRVALLESLDWLERTRCLIQSAVDLLVDDAARRKTGWGIIQDVSLVFHALLGNDPKRGNIHAWIANNEAQVSSWIYFTRDELADVVGHELVNSDTHLSVRDFPLPEFVMDLQWSIQDRALGLVLRTLINAGKDAVKEIKIMDKSKWCLFGD